MYQNFGLTLAVTHACNLRCSYCYAGAKTKLTMPEHIGRTCIDRAVASLSRGGTLELGFFGGEPLLEAGLVATLVDHARARTAFDGVHLALFLTTNGTVTGSRAWSILMMPDLALAISCDGLPTVHDRHRRWPDGTGSAETVLCTIRRLLAAGRVFRVAMVVRPDTVESLPEGIAFLGSFGVDHFEPVLDLWTRWTPDDIARLKRVVSRCARIWRGGLPCRSIGWFDEKAAELARIPIAPSARCGFGQGEIAVAPSGRLYPCERLIGEDADDNPMALAGHALDGDDFLDTTPAPPACDQACDACAVQSLCNTTCRCSNYVRTGNVTKPDRLLCAWNQVCVNETANVMREMTLATVTPLNRGRILAE